MGVPASEMAFDPTQPQGALAAGLDLLAQAKTYQFQQYTRVVLPVDGFVFWKPYGQPKDIKGSLHYALETQQDADQLAGDGDVIFTTNEQLGTLGQPATTSDPSMIYVVKIGENPTDDPSVNPVRFGFTRQGHFYAQAGLWHYTGKRVMPALATQLLDPGNAIDQTRAVVSNSLPLWMAMNGYVSPYPGLNGTVQLYPSYQVAQNLAPPYGVIDVIDTTAIGSAPLLDGDQLGAHSQLCRDIVEITLYGLQNNEAMNFVDFVNQYSLDTDRIGMMNMPVVKDEKRLATEINAIAMKKTIKYEVSYYQTISTTVARQLITKALSDFIINDTPTF